MTALLLSNLLNRPQNGAFVDSCYHHCGGWDKYQVDGVTEAKAFDLWYTGGSAALPKAGRLIDNSSFPCASCVCKYSLGGARLDALARVARPAALPARGICHGSESAGHSVVG